jgi:protein-S-isoprenylcysteine O-methyltransferase Ste14
MIPRDLVRKYRTSMSRIFAIAIVALVLTSESRWEAKDLWSIFFFMTGVILIGTATIGRLWCFLYISGYKSDTLITTGPYSLCRNPLYFFSFLGATGVGLATETLSIPLVLIIFFMLYYPLVIKAEERKLSDIHKEIFAEYCRRTPVFFPSLKLLNEPEEYTIKPKIIRKALLETVWFVWLLGFVELAETLHNAGLLPAVLKLY